MKRFFLLSLCVVGSLFGDKIILENQTPYPSKASKSKMELQWATSSEEMNDKNINTVYQMQGPESTVPVTVGKNQINVAPNQKYFRILVWTKEGTAPTYVTSWVPIVPDKTYRLQEKDLYFSVLTAGSGC